jgi:diguanylate cyclase (GGDEF)-like protein/PAS domain S-box-containing protein
MAVFRASSQAIMTTDAKATIVSVNPAFTRITGYLPEEVIGQRPGVLKSGRHDAPFYQAMWDALLGSGSWEGEIWNRRKNGEIYPQWLTISAVRDSVGQVTEYVALFSDITRRKRQEELVWRQANFDALTGLANRSLLHDRLERALVQAKRSGRKVGLLFIDLDGFKWINDTLGHDAGDDLLIEVARRLESCVREQDTVARLGGDEFTVVVHDLTAADDLQQIGDKVVAILQRPVVLAGGPQHVSGSVGITVFPDDGEDVQTLLKNADIAMYKAKQAGKNRFQFYARQMQVEVLARTALEAELRVAIEAKAFVLHYQPVIDADSGELVGAEALIRWQHPERDLLYPEDFLAVAEDSKLIITIGAWVLREAAQQMRTWRHAGHPLRLAVNVSGLQFLDEGLPSLLESLVAEYGIEPGHLVLEITESALMDGGADLEARMRRIQESGIEYSLDDFGTGYSSLSYLKRFPVNSVKIDRSFVHDCPDDRNDSHLVEAIVKMAHSLELRVVAEGVEKESQITFLRNLGCDYLQGYLISRAVPAAEFEKFFGMALHAAPASADSREKSRLLAALREDDLDVEEWLRRLLGEHSPALAQFLESNHWVSGGLDLKQTIEAHLGWRRRLDHYIGGSSEGAAITAEMAGSAERCALGEWIRLQRSRDGAGAAEPHLVCLDRLHREFHRLAGAIVSDFNAGYQHSAARALSGLKFRTASRDVVVALIACFKDAHSVEGVTTLDGQ